MRDRAIGKRHDEVANAVLSKLQRVTAVRGRALWTKSPWEDEVENREIVRCEVPEHVNIRLHNSVVNADRVNEGDIAQLSGLNELCDLEDRRRVAEGVVGHQDDVCLGRCSDHVPPALHSMSERFFGQDMLASCDGSQGDPLVSTRGRGNGNGVDSTHRERIFDGRDWYGGARSQSQLLGAIEELSETYTGDRRWRIEHAQIVDPADLPRFAKHGTIASMQPTHETSDWRMAEARMGADRLGGAYAWKSMLANDVPLAFGSDYPVENPNPFPGIAAAISREDPQGQPPGGWMPEQKLSLEQTLAAFTRGGAYAGFAEDRLGSLDKGHYADFVLIDRDIFDGATPRAAPELRPDFPLFHTVPAASTKARRRRSSAESSSGGRSARSHAASAPC